MASRIEAINTYRPRIDQGNTVQKGEYTRVLARNSTANEGTVDSILKETRDLLILYMGVGFKTGFKNFNV